MHPGLVAAATPTASPDASFTGTEDGGCTDYMNLPNSAAQTAAFAEDEESSNYMNLPDEHVRPAGRTNSLSVRQLRHCLWTISVCFSRVFKLYTTFTTPRALRGCGVCST